MAKNLLILALFLTVIEAVTVVEDCAVSVISNNIKYETGSKTATLVLELDSKLPVSVGYDTLSLLIRPYIAEEGGGQPLTRRRTRKGIGIFL